MEVAGRVARGSLKKGRLNEAVEGGRNKKVGFTQEIQPFRPSDADLDRLLDSGYLLLVGYP